MIRPCGDDDFHAIFVIINDAAQRYKGVIPPDRWHDPYMSREALRKEINAGVVFWGYEEEGELAGVMGIQNVLDVSLLRHAYVRKHSQNRGMGGRILSFLRGRESRPLLVGTWAAADWAVRFYASHGFVPVTREEKDRLLRKYWTIPERQVETSVVLADQKWLARSTQTDRLR